MRSTAASEHDRIEAVFSTSQLLAQRLNLCLNHFSNQLLETAVWFPTQRLSNLIGGADQTRRLNRPIECRILFHIFFPIETGDLERRLCKFADGMGFAGR